MSSVVPPVPLKHSISSKQCSDLISDALGRCWTCIISGYHWCVEKVLQVVRGLLSLQPPHYVVIGSPGSGKETFAQVIKARGRYKHIPTGGIARKEVEKRTPFGLKYKDAILNHVVGGIPSREIEDLVEQKIKKALSKHKGVILDGYPTTVKQCQALDALIQRKVVVFLDVQEKNAIDRIAARQRLDHTAHGTSKRVYAYKGKIKDALAYYNRSNRLNILDCNAPLEVCLEQFSLFHNQNI